MADAGDPPPGGKLTDPWRSAARTAETTWDGALTSETGLIGMSSGAAGELTVTWASRTEDPDGKTSPEELAAAAHSACYATALALRLGEHKTVPERLTVAAPVTLDEARGVPAIVSSRLRVSAKVPGLDVAGFQAVTGEASELCPVSRLFAGAKITVEAVLETDW